MPPKGDRPSSSSKDRDRQGAGNVGSSKGGTSSKGVSASASAKGNAGASKSSAPAKASTSAKTSGGGGSGSSGTKSVATPAGMRSVSSTSSAASVKASPAAMSVANAPRAAVPAMSPARAAAQPIGPGGSSLSQSAVDPKSFNAASAARAAAPISVAPVSAPVSAAPVTSIRPEARPAEPSGFLGGFTSLADMFDGGGPGQSDTTFEGRLAGLANALGLKPSTGRAGDGRAQAPRSMDRDGPDRGIASLAPVEPVTPANPEVPAMTSAELAAIGAPTSAMSPVFVSTPQYGLPAALPSAPLPPAMNYGSAFMGGPQIPSINTMDIFAAYPNFGMR